MHMVADHVHKNKGRVQQAGLSTERTAFSSRAQDLSAAKVVCLNAEQLLTWLGPNLQLVRHAGPGQPDPAVVGGQVQQLLLQGLQLRLGAHITQGMSQWQRPLQAQKG